MVLKLMNYERRRLRLIAEFVTGKNVLDIGYADQPNPHLTKFRTVGYDIQAPHGNSGYSEEIQGDIKDILSKLSGRKFDTIVCGELVEHIENPYAFLRELRELISDDGRLVISTPNPISFPVFFFELLQIKKFFYTRQHLYYFLPRWVERLVDLSGYDLVTMKPVGFWSPLITLPCPTTLSYCIVYVCKRKSD